MRPNYSVAGKGGSLFCFVLIVLITVTVTGHIWRPHSGRLNARLENSASLALPSSTNETQDDSETIEAEIVTIRPTGFEPAAITRPQGEFLLVINNRSGLEEVTWRLGRETGRNLREVRIHDGKLRSGNFEDLPPGRYVLTEADHPDWICRITITSR